MTDELVHAQLAEYKGTRSCASCVVQPPAPVEQKYQHRHKSACEVNTHTKEYCADDQVEGFSLLELNVSFKNYPDTITQQVGYRCNHYLERLNWAEISAIACLHPQHTSILILKSAKNQL